MKIARHYFAREGPPMGLLCMRAIDPGLADFDHDTPALLVPFEATVASVTLGEATAPLLVDKSGLLFVPARMRYRMTSASALPHLITFLFHDIVRTEAVTDYDGEIDGSDFDELVGQGPALLPRTPWIDQLCHRYVFELTHCHKPTSRAARFVELELTKELYFLLGEHRAHLRRATILDGATTLTERAIAFLEQHLFAVLDLEALAAHCGASESTILRSFKRDLKQSPSDYVRHRRLDEAWLLLKAGRYTVRDVAQRVGYRSAASFTHAFRRRFGHAPSQITSIKESS